MKGTISLIKHKEDVKWNDKIIHKYQVVVGEDMGTIDYWDDDPIDEVGSEIEYTAEETKWGTKIQKPRTGGKSGGGFGAKADPLKTNSIERQTSLKAAVEVAPLFGIKKLTDLLLLAEEFHGFIKGSPAIEIKNNGQKEVDVKVPPHADPKIRANPPKVEPSQQHGAADDLPF